MYTEFLNCFAICLLTIFFCFVTCIASGQTEPISTDRPDQSTTPILVPMGALQIESGYCKFASNSESKNQTSLYESLFKYGLSKNSEIRLSTSFQLSQKQSESTASSLSNPITIGSKFRLLNKNGVQPQLSLVTTMLIDDSRSLSSWINPNAEIIVTCSHELSNRSSLTYNGFSTITFHGRIEVGYTLAYGYGLTKRVGLFLESYGNFQRRSHSLDGGVTVRLSPTIQIDGSAGRSITGDEKSSFFTSGVSIRLFK